jgi:hypothetical protein
MEAPLGNNVYTGTGTTPVQAKINPQIMPGPAVELSQTTLATDPGLVAYYRMEGNANDSKGANNGVPVNVIFGPAYGRFGQGAYCDGNATVAIADALSLDPASAITISAWIYPTGSTSSNERAVAKSDLNDPGGHEQWAMYTNAYSGCCTVVGELYGQVNTTNGSVASISDITRNAILNTWNLLTVTYDGAQVVTYVNGVARVSIAATGPLAPFSGEVAGPLNICSANGRNFFQGYIDDVAIFNRALSTAEVLKLYTGNW